MLHHPDKFSKEACKEKGKKGGKMCPYAIFTAQKKEGDKPHYKEQPHTTKGKPKKKEKYKDEDKKVNEYLHSQFPGSGMPGKKRKKKMMKTFKEFLEEKGFE